MERGLTTMNWQHYTRLIEAKSTSTAAWQIADHANYGSTLDMLALAIHESKAHDVAALIQNLMGEVSDLRLGIQRCDYCGGIKDHFDEKGFEGYLCPRCDADRIATLGKQNERRWMFENAVMRHTRTMSER
jgi:hypothetical protein